MTTDLITRITALAGSSVAEAIRAEFGGGQHYIPPAVAPRASSMSERLRARCLVFMDAARPQPLTDKALLVQIRGDYFPNACLHGLQRELDYLAAAGLLTLTVADTGTWCLRLTKEGIDQALALQQRGAA